MIALAAAAVISTGAVCTSEKLGKPPMASLTCDVTFRNPDPAPRWVLVDATVYGESAPKSTPADDSVYAIDVTRLSGGGKSVDIAKLSVESARNAWAVLLPASATVTVRGLPFSRVGFPPVGVTELALPSRTASSAHLDDPTLTPPLAGVRPSDDGADVHWSSAKPGPRAERDGFSGLPLKLDGVTSTVARLRLPTKSP